VIQQPIPYFLGQYATFQDTLAVDDTTEALTLTKPDGTTLNVAHADLTRVVNPDNSVTYSYTVALNQHGAWLGQFVSTGLDANVAPVQAYVAL
jgi:hypothetical protein